MAAAKKRSNGRETMEKILDHARAELDAVGAVKFNILRVIENSGVSRSSVYHHFGDRDGVIAAVEVDRLIQEMKGLNDAVRNLVSVAAAAEDVFEAIRMVLTAAGSPEGRRQRTRRLQVMVAALDIPLLAETLREEQADGDRHMATTLGIAAERGLIQPVENPLGTAHLISSLFIGRAIVDVIGDPQADADWVDTTMVVLRSLLRTGS